VVSYIHSKGILHRDIKVGNFLINPKTYKIHLIDFGMSTCWNTPNKISVILGNPEYYAPEVLFNKGNFEEPSDVWAVGVVIYRIWYKKFPFGERDAQKVRDNIKKLEY
jgi:polo-like kinase 3